MTDRTLSDAALRGRVLAIAQMAQPPTALDPEWAERVTELAGYVVALHDRAVAAEAKAEPDAQLLRIERKVDVLVRGSFPEQMIARLRRKRPLDLDGVPG